MRLAIYFIFFLGWISNCTDPSPQAVNNTDSATDIFEKDNLVAWCVVPFDSLQRGPYERAQMLHDLGFTKFAYDWREQHLPTFAEEVQAMQSHGIELSAVWWWIDGQGDSLLNASNRQLLHYLDSLNLACDIWMSFDERFFHGLEDSAKLQKAVSSIQQLHAIVDPLNLRLQLYNHGEWFGNPVNQVEIIEASGLNDVGIVYNFHHAHKQMDDFPHLLKIMKSYLSCVNINGMRENGPQILTVGEGDQEKAMLQALVEADYRGYIGIIGHLENEDVEVVLKRNLEGLRELTKGLETP